jgi:hypothetical protein
MSQPATSSLRDNHKRGSVADYLAGNIGEKSNLSFVSAYHGSDMRPYDALLQKSIAAIARSFQKRVATGMQSGRDFVLPTQSEQVWTEGDFERVTWVVIR